MKARKIALYVVTAFVTSVALAVLVAYVVLQHYLGEEEAKAFDVTAAERYGDAVAKDLETLDSDPFFASVRDADKLNDRKLDAGSVMNLRLPWQSAGGELPPAVDTLALPPELQAKLADWDKDWLLHADDPSLKALDFGWMHALRAYSYWDLEATGPLADALKEHPDLDPVTFPAPELQQLGAWVKLRLLQAQNDMDPERGLADVQHVAYLTLTTQTTVFELVGLSYLSWLDHAAAALRHAGKLPLSWQGVDLERILTARRALWSEAQYLDLGISPKLAAKIFPEGKQRPGACAVLDERLPALAMVKPLLAPSYPAKFRVLDDLVERVAAGCRDRAMLRLWRDPQYVALPLRGNLFDLLNLGEMDEKFGRTASSQGEGITLETVERLPLLRRGLGLVLTNVAKPSFLGPYTDGDEDGDEEPDGVRPE